MRGTAWLMPEFSIIISRQLRPYEFDIAHKKLKYGESRLINLRISYI